MMKSLKLTCKSFFNRFFRKYGENFFLEILQSIHETGLADFRKLVVSILKLSYK